MTRPEQFSSSYTVSVREAESPDGFCVSYAPRGLQQARGMGGAPKRVPQPFEILVSGERCSLKWIVSPKDPVATQKDFESDAVVRVKLLREWLALLTPLLDSIERWADELGWAKRRVQKLMEGDGIGDYLAPALLLQEDMIRIAVDPIGRSAPGTDGIVDMYLMPAYDDIARFHYHGARWHLRSIMEGGSAGREFTSKPLSKKVFREILDGIMNSVG